MSRTIYILIWGIFICQKAWAGDSPAYIWQELSQKGYYELEERPESAFPYRNLYQITDAFWEDYKVNEDMQETIKTINANFSQDKRNVTGITVRGKPEPNWQQVEVSQEYLDYISKSHLKSLQQWPSFALLHKNMQALLDYSNGLFKDNVDKLASVKPEIKDIIYQSPDDTLITVKIIYRLIADQAHFDLSGLSLFLNTDQDPQIDSLRLAPPGKYCYKDAYQIIPKKYAQSVYLIPGAVLEELGVNIKATAHLVDKPKQLRRSAIAFARILRAPFGSRPIMFPRFDDRGRQVSPCIRGLFVQDHFLPSDKKYFLRYYWEKKPIE